MHQQGSPPMASLNSVDTLLGGFPHNPLPRIVGKPTFATLSATRKLLCANAASIPSLLGGGGHGHLGMILSAARYAILAPGTPYDTPAFPGAVPTHGANASAALRSDTNSTFKSNQRIYSEYVSLQAALKKQLIQAVDEVYLQSLHDNTVGFANVTVRAMLNHLFTAHGAISQPELRLRIKSLDDDWDPATELVELFRRYTDTREFATAAGVDIPVSQLLNSAYSAIYNTGLYFNDLEKWDEKAAADHTWPNFQTFFCTAQHKLQSCQRTSSAAGYHGAHALIARAESAEVTAANVAAAAHQERSQYNATLRDLTATITELTNQVRHLSQQLAASQSTVAHLRRQNPAHTATDDTTVTTSNRRRQPRDSGTYCWTHGYCVHRDHTSGTCTNKAAGHKDNATKTDTMGGSIRFREFATN